MWSLTLFTLLNLGWIVTVYGLPPSNINTNINFRPPNVDQIQTPAQERSWGSKLWGKKNKEEEEGPSYAINPNFGFRSYHQIRYEPMTVPFEYSEPPAQIPPVDFGYPAPVDSYDGGNDYRALPTYENVNSYGGGNEYLASQSEFNSRQSPYSSSSNFF